MVERAFLAQPLSDAGLRGIVSPFQFVTTGEDCLRVRMYSTQDHTVEAPSIEMGIRSVDTDGDLQVATLTLTGSTTPSAVEAIQSLGRCAIVNLAVRYVPVGYPFGVTYVTVELVRGTPPGHVTLIGQLLGDYVGPGKSLAWPGSPITDWQSGPGLQRRVPVLGGGAGFELGLDIQSPRAYRVRAFSATFAASGIAGTRYPGVSIFATVSPASPLARLPLLTTIAAGGGGDFSWADGYGSQMTAVPPRYFGPMPRGILLAPGYSIYTFTTGLLGGDLWSNGALWVDELIVPSGL